MASATAKPKVGPSTKPTRGRPKGSEKTPGSGRQKGTPNKATADLRGIAREYTEEAVLMLVSVMRDPKMLAVARVQAAKEILDRGHGKPAAAVDVNLNNFDPLLY